MTRLLVLGIGTACFLAGLLLAGLGDSEAQTPKKVKVPEFIETLKNKSAGASKRTEAAQDLGKLAQVNSPPTRPAIPVLLSILKDGKDDSSVRRACAETLGKIASEPETVVPALVAVLNNDKENVGVRTSAANGLGYMGSDAKEAVSDLRKIAAEFKGKDKGLAKAAQGALKMINPKKK
jgi:HEAT repeat protein